MRISHKVRSFKVVVITMVITIQIMYNTCIVFLILFPMETNIISINFYKLYKDHTPVIVLSLHRPLYIHYIKTLFYCINLLNYWWVLKMYYNPLIRDTSMERHFNIYWYKINSTTEKYV